MSKKLLPFLIALVFALAGCLGITDDSDPAGEGTEGPQETQDPGASGNETDDGEKGDDDNETTNSPPSASLEANVTSGASPLNVTFSLDGSDPDDDNVTWSLDFGDDSEVVEGEELPAEAEHSFTEGGNFTVTLIVDDGTDTSNQTVVISVTESTGPVQTHSGGWTASIPVYCGIAGSVHAELNGIFTEGIEVDPASIGNTFTTTFASVVEEAIVEYSVHFIDTADGFDIIGSFSGEPGAPVTGEVPEDSDEVYFSACGVSGPVDVEYAA